METLAWHYQVLCFLLLILYHPTSAQQCPHDQTQALFQFRSSFSTNSSSLRYLCNDPSNSYPKTQSWKEGTDCCLWEGVTCDNATGYVIGLDLSCSWLLGTIPSNSSLFLLPHLQRLNLAYNDFESSLIPSELFSKFSGLTHLNLSDSTFSGAVPSEISLLSKLVSLDLSDNSRLSFDEPTFTRMAQNLTHLRHLFLDRVNMSLVSPASFQNLSSAIVSLHLRASGLTGRFPDNVFRFPYLQELVLSINHDLTCNFPSTNWSNPLRLLDLSYTSFVGELPKSIGNLKYLEKLNLMFCGFKSSIPDSIGNLTQMTHLDLSFNSFEGQLPSTLSNLWQLTFLDLSSNSLEGNMPDIFGNFKNLPFLQLTNNRFTGQLPLSAFNLTQLTFIDFSRNRLEGPLPSQISELRTLKSLRLSENSLTGRIPSWLFTLPSLESFELNGNKFTGPIEQFQQPGSVKVVFLGNNEILGQIPNSVFKLANLTHLDLSSNKLSGIVETDALSKLENLQELDLSSNSMLSLRANKKFNYTLPNLQRINLSSCALTEFPKFLQSLENLLELDLSKNAIRGSISKEESDVWKSLYYLDLSNNYLTSIEQNPWKNVRFLYLHSNMLEGPLPVPPPSTQALFISNNKLTGDLPSMLCNLSSLEVLDLSYNNLSGRIPECLGNFSSYLTVLNLEENQINGKIPGTFSEVNRLSTLNFNGNKLEGPLPRTLADCAMLEVLNLGNNKIRDTFPHWLDSLPELHVLILRSNRFHGPIDTSKTRNPFPKLRVLDLSHNEFTGLLPAAYFESLKAMETVEETDEAEYLGGAYYQDSMVVTVKGLDVEYQRILTIFTTIDMSSNKFEGQIPVTVGHLSAVRVLNFSHNSLLGHIPSCLGNLSILESFDLSWNKLTGEIPGQLTNLQFLEVLNLSQNQLVGPIPQGKQFGTFLNDSYTGNLGLCGFPMSKSCSNDEPPESRGGHDDYDEDDNSASSFDWKSAMMGYGCGIVIGVSAAYIVFATGSPWWLVKMVEKERLKRERRPTNPRIKNRRHHNRT